MENVPFWLQIFNIPSDSFNQEVVRTTVSCVGRVLDMNICSKFLKLPLDVVWVKISFKKKRTIPLTSKIPKKFGLHATIQFKYEVFPICLNCGKITHTFPYCLSLKNVPTALPPSAAEYTNAIIEPLLVNLCQVPSSSDQQQVSLYSLSPGLDDSPSEKDQSSPTHHSNLLLPVPMEVSDEPNTILADSGVTDQPISCETKPKAPLFDDSFWHNPPSLVDPKAQISFARLSAIISDMLTKLPPTIIPPTFHGPSAPQTTTIPVTHTPLSFGPVSAAYSALPAPITSPPFSSTISLNISAPASAIPIEVVICNPSRIFLTPLPSPVPGKETHPCLINAHQVTIQQIMFNGSDLVQSQAHPAPTTSIPPPPIFSQFVSAPILSLPTKHRHGAYSKHSDAKDIADWITDITARATNPMEFLRKILSDSA
ncbi:uncharacterized protein LOC122088867 [Macadamia integrifolia]|uniref:uncharacterized protein LOC122088867 n=1 Tax=Macadamia integrifolia TaxID=60698 RepID=UPI001C4FB511|nr:uncharacterized protein LOC122088867 [Macadamia integrifolia]